MKREISGMKIIKVEWCEGFVKALFKKRVPENGGIEVSLFWNLAEKSGLWIRGTYGSPMSHALEKLTTVEHVEDDGGNYLYTVFRLKKTGGN